MFLFSQANRTAMTALYALLAIVAVPILFFMLTWVAVTACKILFPPKESEVGQDPGHIRHVATRKGYSIPVGVREIREDQRYFTEQINQSTYHYEQGDSEGLPMVWYEELVNRRN